jgi:hypothetical protein
MDVNFDDPKIANLPRVLLMGPRRAGKTSIQVSRKENGDEWKKNKVRQAIAWPSTRCWCSLRRHCWESFLKFCLLHAFIRLGRSTVPLVSFITQRVVFQKVSPHETLFRLEATQGLE